MHKESIFTTARLSIEPLQPADSAFIRILVNTEGWLKFIGDRKVHSDGDAIAYIQKILANPNVIYWIVKLQKEKTAIGLISFIKRDYLEHHDIGFAFLPELTGKGYAYEAASKVLNEAMKEGSNTHILATTIPENSSSIKLLTKLGLAFEKEIIPEQEILHLYSISASEPSQ